MSTKAKEPMKSVPKVKTIRKKTVYLLTSEQKIEDEAANKLKAALTSLGVTAELVSGVSPLTIHSLIKEEVR